MTIQFNEITGNQRVPLWYAEFNAAQSPYQSISRLLLIGQKAAAGTATAGVPIQVTSNEDGLFGLGSMLAAMYKISRRNAPFQEIWCLPLADDAAGVVATGKFVIGGSPPASAGTLSVWIGKERVRVAVSTADTDSAIAARLVAAINATAGLPVTAAQGGVGAEKEVIITARHKGALGNKIKLHIDYYGDDNLLASELVTVTPMAGGAGDPVINAALAALGDEEYDFIGSPYADLTNLGHVNAFLSGSSGRWSPASQLYGGYFTAKDDTSANLGTFGNGLNDPHVTIMGYYNSPSPPWEWAAAYAAKAAQHLSDPPELSRPLHTLVLEGILPAKLIADRFGKVQRQALYYDGIAASHVRRSGEVCIDRAVTTYQLNPWGIPDASWLDIETMYQGAYAIRYLRAKVVGTWGRASLRDDNPFGVQGVATPDAVRDTIIHGYRELSALNVVENEDLFETLVIVERNRIDANRLDIFIPIDHVNQLRVIAVNVTSYLNFEQPVAA